MAYLVAWVITRHVLARLSLHGTIGDRTLVLINAGFLALALPLLQVTGQLGGSLPFAIGFSILIFGLYALGGIAFLPLITDERVLALLRRDATGRRNDQTGPDPPRTH